MTRRLRLRVFIWSCEIQARKGSANLRFWPGAGWSMDVPASARAASNSSTCWCSSRSPPRLLVDRRHLKEGLLHRNADRPRQAECYLFGWSRDRTRPACRRRRCAVGFVSSKCSPFGSPDWCGKVCGATPQTTCRRRVLPIPNCILPVNWG